MKARHAIAVSFLLGLMVVAPITSAAAPTTDQQISTILAARNKKPAEAKWIMDRLSQGQKEDIIREQAKIDALVGGRKNLDLLSADEKLQLWNSTKVIDALVSGEGNVAEESLVCTRERPLGSQMAKRVCRSKAQVAADRERARKNLEDSQTVHSTR